MNTNRGAWYLVTGLVIGLIVGLLISLKISPVMYKDISPSAMQSEGKDAYRVLIASAYSADGDLGRAKARLGLLGDPDAASVLAAQAQQMMANGGSMTGARQLAVLAAALGQQPGKATLTPTVVSTSAPTGQPLSEVQQPTAAGIAAATSAPTDEAALQETPLALADLPTVSPSATPHPPYELDKVTPICDPALTTPTLQVQVRDANQKGVPGVGISVAWSGGQDEFYTGLKPKVGDGYADFTMNADVEYTLRLTDGGEPVSNLASQVCRSDTDGASYPGSLLVEFKQ